MNFRAWTHTHAVNLSDRAAALQEAQFALEATGHDPQKAARLAGMQEGLHAARESFLRSADLWAELGSIRAQKALLED